jgi:hypothetical protein
VATTDDRSESEEPGRTGSLEGKIWLAPDWDSDETNGEIARLFYGEDDEAEASPG